MLHETSITCPRCKLEFPITETLAQPFITAERTKIEREAQERAAELKKQESALSTRQLALDELKRQLDARQREIDKAVERKNWLSLFVYAMAVPLAFQHPQMALGLTAFVTIIWVTPTVGIKPRQEHPPRDPFEPT